jgi:hypothetical protein
MTIASTTNRNNYTGNGSTEIYNYTFRIFSEDDLLVTVREIATGEETTLVKTTDYTVTGVSNSAGGTVVLVDANQDWLDADGDLDSAYEISIRRVLDLVQETDIRNQGDFYPEGHEDQFDKCVMIAQQQQDEIDRSVKLPESIDPADFDASMPASIVGQAGVSIITNPDGDGFIEGPTASEIAAAQAQATAAAASALAAANSATAADTSADAAAVSEANATALAASMLFRSVLRFTSADSPLTLTQAAHNGKLLVFDTSGGAISVTLPQISGVTLPFNVTAMISVAGNNLTFNRAGTDTIAGATSKVMSIVNTGAHFIAESTSNPDQYAVIDLGTVGDLGITAAKIAANAVETAKILDANVTKAKLATGAKDLAVTSKTANYTLVAADELVSCDSSGGAFTLTLPTAVGLTGRVFTLKKTDSSFNAVTIDGNGTETIDGALTKKLSTQNEMIRIVSNGSNWLIIDRHIPSVVTAYTPTYVGFGTVASVTASWVRKGHLIRIVHKFTSGTSTATTASATLPSGLTAASSTYIPALSVAGLGERSNTGTVNYSHLIEAAATVFYFSASAAVTGLLKDNGDDVLTSGASFSGYVEIPIEGWD